MLRLLLDVHISPKVALGLRRRHRSLAVHFIVKWENGRFLGADETACLEHAVEQKITLVTYDRRTNPPLLKAWVEAGREHGGIIFIDEKTIEPADIGGQVRALASLVRKAGSWDWTERICFLQR